MSEETKNNEKQSNGQTAAVQTSKKTNLKWVFVTIAVVALAAIMGTMAYTNSPGYRAGKKLELAEKFLDDTDYEQAIANFKLALEIDPNNQKVIASIKSHMEEFYQQSRNYGEMGEYGKEREIAAFMLNADSESVLAKIAEAEADCGNGDVKKAKDGFENIISADPGNDEIAIVVGDNLDKFYEQARKYGSEGEYASEKELAEFMIKVCPDNVRGQIAGAEADSGMGDVEKAKAEYQEAAGGGVDEDDVAKGIKYCDAVLKLLEYCEQSKWDEAAAYMNADDFGAVSERLVEGKSVKYSRKVDILVGKSDGGVYVYCGGLENGIMGGNGVGIVSGVNTCSIYEGGWKDNFPSGKGVLTMWNKNEDISRANVYEGDFSNGVLNGAALLKAWVGDAQRDINLEIDNGQVKVDKVDDKGRILMSVAESTYALEYETAENNAVANYAAGVYGFGGSDRILSFGILDTVPPVIKCNLVVGTMTEETRWDDGEVTYSTVPKKEYNGRNPIGQGITASDNVDGDLTAKITNTSRRKADSDGIFVEDQIYDLVVVYSVADSSGNTAELTVTYHCWVGCGDGNTYYFYSVLNVK